jgi:Fur family ferric uptake transcriptional regulator
MVEMHLEQTLRGAGERITPQRRLIAGILLDQGGHLSADDIHQLARREHPRLSLATVYRTLRWLKEYGVVRELRLNGNRYRYEIAQEETHQHMICQGCGKVIEFNCSHCSDVHKGLVQEHKFHVTGVRVKVLGYCSECQAHIHNQTH